MEGGFNIFIAGSDTREGQDGVAGEDTGTRLNDVNMLLHVSANHTRAVAVSIPRDLVVPFPECPREDGEGSYSAAAALPINSALDRGGLPCAVLTVEQLTGLDIQFAGLITFKGVIEMSNAVGGVPVCIDGPIADDATELYLPEAGTYTLAGADALKFLRSRHGVGDGSDLGRISSQQVYLSSLVRTLKSADTLGDISKVYGIAKAATSNMTLSTSLASLDTMAAIALALKDIPLENVTFVQYPGATELGGVYHNRVAPIKAQADELFEMIRTDQPFALDADSLRAGAVADPNAPATPGATAPADPAAPANPAAPADPSAAPATAEVQTLSGVKGQTAADYTCSQAN